MSISVNFNEAEISALLEAIKELEFHHDDDVAKALDTAEAKLRKARKTYRRKQAGA